MDRKEGKSDSTELNYFQELKRINGWIALKAIDREMMILLQSAGGVSKTYTDNGTSWQRLYVVNRN